MLGFFTDPYPDELFYSVCARYQSRVRYRFRPSATFDIFGRELCTVPIGLPGNIDCLISRLPAAHQYTADRIIDENTLLPFYGPFLPPERLRLLRACMRRKRSGRVLGIYAGLSKFGIHLDVLRFCPSCAEEDNELFGEAYWHRTHQAPGAEVCSKHCVFLEKSNIKAGVSNLRRETLITAKEAVSPSRARPLVLSEATNRMRLQVSRDISWLLGQRNLTSDPIMIRRRYVELLIQNGMGSLNGQVSTVEVQARLDAFYSTELLESLHCTLSGTSNWLTRLIRKSKGAHHPLRHLLLINFLGLTAAEFFNFPTRDYSLEARPFGLGPWPCLNRASDHYREPRIKDVVINSTEGPVRRPRGTFCCDCGFTYSRHGPDSSEEARYKITQTVEFGPVWEAALTTMWQSRLFSREAMARRLGSCNAVIRRQATRLGLYQRPAEVGIPNLHDNAQQQPVIMMRSVKQTMFREQWLRAIADAPNASRVALRRSLPSAHKWLSRHNRQWLEAHSPPPMRGRTLHSGIDWEARDIALAAAVRETASQLMHAGGRPKRVSVEAIFRNMNCHRPDVFNRLPQTVEALAEVSESVESFAIRRIHWAADNMRREGARITRSYLLERAAVSAKIAASPDVGGAVESYLIKQT